MRKITKLLILVYLVWLLVALYLAGWLGCHLIETTQYTTTTPTLLRIDPPPADSSWMEAPGWFELTDVLVGFLPFIMGLVFLVILSVIFLVPTLDKE